MGMFDSIAFEISPIKCECGHEQKNFQTKQYACLLEKYIVTKDNKLQYVRNVWELTEEFKKDTNARPICRTRAVNIENLNWTDTIHCYSSCDKCGKYWFDVLMVWIAGKLHSINVQKKKLEKENENEQ
jgi:hypothetical protein